MGRAVRVATRAGCAVRAATRADWAGRSATRVFRMFGGTASIRGPADGLPTGPVGGRTFMSCVLSGQLPSERAATSCGGVQQLFMRA